MYKRQIKPVEEWKDIYENGQKLPYQISNFGQVKNSETGDIRVPSIANGYYHIILYYMQKPVCYHIHRLVAYYFVPNPDIKTKTQVNHIDGNKLNNVWTNLEWVSPKENKQHAIAMGLDNPHHGHQKRGEESGVAKHTEKEARSVCEVLAKGFGPTATSKMLHMDYEFVRSIYRGRAWNHISREYTLKTISDGYNGKGSTTIDQSKKLDQ